MQLVAPALIARQQETDWSKWHVFFADERCVPLDHADSNYGAAKKVLLDKLPIPSEQIVTVNPDLSPSEAAVVYQERLGAVTGGDGEAPPVLDCVLLGMGPDGHTCSLFPGHSLLDEDKKWVASIEDSPKPPPSRITLTMPVLQAARKICFVSTGEGKADMLKRIMDGDQAIPCAVVQPGRAEWYVDTAAASKL